MIRTSPAVWPTALRRRQDIHHSARFLSFQPRLPRVSAALTVRSARDSSRNAVRLVSCTIITLSPPRSRGWSQRSLSIRLHAIKWPAATGQAMRLHRPVAYAGSSGPVDPAGSRACRGWCWSKLKAYRTPEKGNDPRTNSTWSNYDCHKFYCGSALNSFRAWVGSRNKATDCGCFLYAAGFSNGIATRDPEKQAAPRKDNRNCESAKTKPPNHDVTTL